MAATWDALIRHQHSTKIVVAYPTLVRPDGLGGLDSTTLRLSTHAISPAKTAHFHRPCLKGVPNLVQAIREPFFGQSQGTHGSLEIVCTDGALDDYVANWHWNGQPVAIALGFPELDVSDYRVIFSGMMGEPKENDRLLRVPILDAQEVALKRTLAEGEYSGAIPNLVQTCLTAAGITAVDASAWAAWAAANNFTAWFKAQGESVGSLLDKLIGAIGCWYNFDRQGRFVVATLAAPDAGAADLALVDDVRLLAYEGQVFEKHYWQIKLKYLTATSPSPVYATLTAEDEDILRLNPRATAIERETCLTNSTHAQAVLDRLWALFSVRRRIRKATAKVEPLTVNLGGQVYLSRPRFGLAGNQRVIGLSTVLAGQTRVALELMA